MNVASLENCKELFALSGWNDTDYTYYANAGQHSGTMMHRSQVFDKPDNLPAYDLGFLLDRLPLNIDGSFFEMDHYGTDNGYWVAHYCRHNLNTEVYTYKFGNYGDIPEDAAAKLCIELFKQEVLTKPTTPADESGS